MTALDAHIAAAVGQLEGILAKLGEGAADQRGGTQPPGDDRRGQEHVALPVHAVVAVQVGVDVPDIEVAEVQVLDEPARLRSPASSIISDFSTGAMKTDEFGSSPGIG
jgi:hypothetical protein